MVYNVFSMIYDLFQKKAIDYIKHDYSVLVSAPTGAGKTVIAEYVIRDALNKNKRVIYTAPIKAISNQKYRDFHENFADKIGILTGDVSINPFAPILIMTTEIFRNKLLEETPQLDEYSWIIFDEIHYLDDYERGTVWEESLIFLPEHMKVLALSATIPNIRELADWIHSIHKKPLKIVYEDKRPVPLHLLYQSHNTILEDIKSVKKIAYSNQKPYFYHGRQFFKPAHVKPNRTESLFKHLIETNRLPCIYFSFGRRRCENLAEEIHGIALLDEDEKLKISKLYKELCNRFDLAGERSAENMLPLIEKGIAFHHAGMLPTLKEVVERLFTSKLIKVIFTTETFALGINMPARTVVFDELRKFYGRFHSTLRTRDFYQMAGRAGRRSIDEEGFVYSRINPRYLSFQQLKSVIYNEPEKVQSRFNLSYATILNLYEKYGERLYDIYPLSFHYYQENKKGREKSIRHLRAKVQLLKQLGYIRKSALTQKGVFASKIYGYELSMGELFEQDILENLSEIELGIIALALVFEPRKDTLKPKADKRTKKLSASTGNILNRIQHLEKKFSISPLSKKYEYHLTVSLQAWMHNMDFESILHFSNVDEGEIIRYFRMAIQILREMLDTPAPKELKHKIHKAIGLINRDIIDAEKQLRL